uniref:Uncharacterized protein n=1 Tax=Anguilla anguilla TaxID=7936 RepID=A0A0E9SWV8_ANGAN
MLSECKTEGNLSRNCTISSSNRFLM